MLLIDHDQAEIGEGEKESRAGTDHELGFVLGHCSPDAPAHWRRHAGVPLGGA
jgi:hypothetical protein